MHPYPHVYRVSAKAVLSGNVTVESPGLPPLQTAPPVEFDGPGDAWSPETLLCGAIADCFILTFRAVARAAKFEWSKLECHVDGTLERVEGVAQFTKYAVHVTLTLAGNGDEAKAKSLLERSERGCLISNSVRGERTLYMEVLSEV
ncbi:OsmC family protein [Peristeroidobacter soli]|jgi:peroxiredoxin-like protein|uniref:OsmC family protein n=1 Tax=Peristeroidobacter soli TaxID=2497877 RepID=UPI00101D9675|nr:OsmC family protein [Peristeroidobacter soli]